MGLFNFFKKANGNAKIDLTDFKFISDNHVIYQNGVKVAKDNAGKWRGIRIQKNKGGESYIFTLYNLSEENPMWEDNIALAPKPMKIIRQSKDKIEMRGYGHHQMRLSFSDYGITLKLKGKEIYTIILHFHDRNRKFIFLKSNG